MCRRGDGGCNPRRRCGAWGQAQVDWGSLPYIQRRIWVFVMTLGYSRAGYVELVRKADTAAFMQCHVNAFEYLGGVPSHVGPG